MSDQPAPEFDHAGALSALAKRIYAESPNLEAAKLRMEEEVWKDEHLFGPITHRAVKEAVRVELLAAQRETMRVPVAPQAVRPVVARPERPNIQAWGGAVQSGLMASFILPNRKKLGDARREDLQAAVNGFETTSTDARIKAQWMRLILQGLPASRTVSQHYSEKRIADLRQEARRG